MVGPTVEANEREPAADEMRSDDGRRLRVVAGCALLAGVYAAAAFFSLRLAIVEENVTPLWPPTGIAVAALLLFGTRWWPGIAIGALVVNLPITPSPLAAAATAAGNTLAPVLAVWILRRARFRTELDRPRDVVVLLVAALFSMTVSASIGAGTLVLSDQVPAGDFWTSWSVWWAGDSMGVLVVAPFLLVLWNRAHHRYPPPRRLELLELFVVLALLAAVALFAVTAEVSMLFVALPFVGWASWRFEQSGAAPAALLVSSAATWAAVGDRGPFMGADLVDRMITLQGFNATVAFTAFFLAALVSERARSRQALERGAADLEARVQRRTTELSEANQRLAAQIAERREAESRLRRSERQLAEAHEVANIGAWEWDLAGDEVSWSEEMFRIHGAEPGAFQVTFERAIEFIAEADRPRIRRNTEVALEQRRAEVPDVEYRIELPDGRTKHLHARSRFSLADDGTPVRMFGIVQDVTERHEFEREHRIADTLQRSLLPASFPEMDGVSIAARYVPAERGLAAGGDWYDVIALGAGRVALVIGDVAGHGLEAASLMGQLRTAVRAYALEGHPPTVVAERTDALMHEVAEDEMATLLFVALDVEACSATIVCAGHPPPIAIGPGGARLLEVDLAPPLGFGPRSGFRASTATVQTGDTLLLYTDGLIDRHDLAIDLGLRRLLAAAEANREADPDELCDQLLSAMVSGDVSDDIAVLAVCLAPTAPGDLRLRIPAEPDALSQMRRRLARWLDAAGVPADVRGDVVLASSEAAANSIRHAYGPSRAWVEVEAAVSSDEVHVVVRDRGRWRAPRGRGGRGLSVIEACMRSVEIDRGAAGTEVRMRRPIRTKVAS
ncbi:MAG TPA: SpoIIE family protein phosphatase [Actinomycetota bacterium]|nr:SpoIIE family protein phosphatase [Actinomycetota bacterium]